MIIWINGPFGGGKSSVAAELRHHIPQTTLYDPEEVGFMLRNLLPGREADFQDQFSYRHLNGLPVRDYRGDVDLEPIGGVTRIR